MVTCAVEEERQGMKNFFARLTDQIDNIEKKLEHLDHNQQQLQQQHQQQPSHQRQPRQPPTPPPPPQPQQLRPNESEQQFPRRRCFTCGKLGHISRNCYHQYHNNRRPPMQHAYRYNNRSYNNRLYNNRPNYTRTNFYRYDNYPHSYRPTQNEQESENERFRTYRSTGPNGRIQVTPTHMLRTQRTYETRNHYNSQHSRSPMTHIRPYYF